MNLFIIIIIIIIIITIIVIINIIIIIIIIIIVIIIILLLYFKWTAISEFRRKITDEISTYKPETVTLVLVFSPSHVFHHNLRRSLTCVDILTLTCSMQ